MIRWGIGLRNLVGAWHAWTMSRFPVILTPGDDGFVVAECPVIPGCVSQGATRDEAIANISEAIALCLETRSQEGWSLPESYELVELPVAV